MKRSGKRYTKKSMFPLTKLTLRNLITHALFQMRAIKITRWVSGVFSGGGTKHLINRPIC